MINLHQAYGAAGVVKITQILRREIVTAMRLVGAATIEDLRPEMVSTLLYDHGVMSYVSSQVERVDWQPRLVTKL